MQSLILQIISGVLGLWLAVKFVPGVDFFGDIKYLILAGAVLGLLNFFIKPILNFVTLPLRLLTFGMFSLIIDMILIWAVDLFFLEIDILLWMPLVWTTLIIWGMSSVVSIIFPMVKKPFAK